MSPGEAISTSQGPATGERVARPPRRWVAPLLEAALSVFVAALFVASCILIHVNATNRLGQVAGLAAIEFRFVLFAIAAIVVLVIAARRRQGAGFARASRYVCAAVAGLATGVIGGGITVALHGTPWGINGRGGDVGHLALWAKWLHEGQTDLVPAVYPPLPLHFLHWYSDLTGLIPGMALKHFEIAGVALAGPIAYMSWRLLFRPGWALAIGVVASLPLIEPYKPYPNLVLVVFLPVVIRFLMALRRSGSWTELRIAQAGVGYGIAFGALCLMYSGWFQWAVPGLVVAAALVFPWHARRKGIYLLALTAALFLLVTKQYALGMLQESLSIKDTYVYFDVKTEPAYIAMWRNDTPGIVGVWPPIGELGGVGLFTIILAIGLGLAVALGRRKTFVLGAACVMAGAWVMRFRYARMLWETKLVQLYPRTTPLILYCLLVLLGFAIYLLAQRRRRDEPAAASRFRESSWMIGAIAALLLYFGSAGSALSDRFMPVNTNPAGPGWLTWISHQTKKGMLPQVIKARALSWVRRPIEPSP